MTPRFQEVYNLVLPFCFSLIVFMLSSFFTNTGLILYEPVNEISNNGVCAASKASDQPAHARSLIRAFASRFSILLTEHHLEFLSLKGGCRGSSESTHVKMPHCWKSHATAHI